MAEERYEIVGGSLDIDWGRDVISVRPMLVGEVGFFVITVRIMNPRTQVTGPFELFFDPVARSIGSGMFSLNLTLLDNSRLWASVNAHLPPDRGAAASATDTGGTAERATRMAGNSTGGTGYGLGGGARSRRESPRRSAQERRQPQYHTGPKGGTYVLSAKGEKLYVPTTAASWESTANGRWRLTLRDGRSMVYPMLQ
jgi:hypothetical protein